MVMSPHYCALISVSLHYLFCTFPLLTMFLFLFSEIFLFISPFSWQNVLPDTQNECYALSQSRVDRGTLPCLMAHNSVPFQKPVWSWRRPTCQRFPGTAVTPEACALPHCVDFSGAVLAPQLRCPSSSASCLWELTGWSVCRKLRVQFPGTSPELRNGIGWPRKAKPVEIVAPRHSSCLAFSRPWVSSLASCREAGKRGNENKDVFRLAWCCDSVAEHLPHLLSVYEVLGSSPTP